jgi:hypothetical protein
VRQTGERATTLLLCNTIGVPLDQREVPIAAAHVVMTPIHIVVASEKDVYIWQFRVAQVGRIPSPTASPIGTPITA